MYMVSLLAIPLEVILLFYHNTYLVFVTLAFLSLRFWKIAVYIGKFVSSSEKYLLNIDIKTKKMVSYHTSQNTNST